MNALAQLFDRLQTTIFDKTAVRDLVTTVTFLLVLLVLRAVIRRTILQRNDLPAEVKRRWLVTLRNVALIITLVGLVTIWAHELQTLAVSLVAIAAAIVLATKEMILCLMGSIYRTSTNVFTVGDRIEVAGIKGQVIDTNLLSFTITESSHVQASKGTVGRGVTLPNSVLLSNPLYNETMLGTFVVQTIHINIERNDDWQRAESVLLTAAHVVVDEYRDELQRHAREVAMSYALETPTLEPRLRISLDDREEIGLHLQLPVPLGQRARIEQRLIRDYLLGMQAATAP
ncbi:Mechanosensitive ion channel [Andreprevotia lacus DSM 23236]|jgi:small-conductance mechanosensitive channel|uniref:Mechanosensitive ion channel n=1 Tax=Andreprevotia lacus DSM 23236 TaxID=1121001 RepID=A0A1W1XIG3_9NEIS|nr:mechanosensitive ion channel domain-containing protein [Andreprevotia lacus]SMC23749.1 Mechanosensitive ion channel [Andreprevotia lacus DSM 23236]